MHFYHIQFSKLLNIFTDNHFYSLYSYFMSRWFTIIEQNHFPMTVTLVVAVFVGRGRFPKTKKQKTNNNTQ